MSTRTIVHGMGAPKAVETPVECCENALRPFGTSLCYYYIGADTADSHSPLCIHVIISAEVEFIADYKITLL